MTTFQSFAQWNREEVGHDETTDEHSTEEAAWGVVMLLRKMGYGGDGRYFPIASGVRII